MPTPKILLVDDTRLFLELEKNFLRLSPVHVMTASNGVEALEVARKERPSIIFMDLHMPLMDGATCCKAMKADPELRGIPVIMVTSAGKEEDLRQCMEAGCDDYLTKPVDRHLFLEKGRKFLSGIDRRQVRVPCAATVNFRAHNLSFSGVSADISIGGIFVATDYDLEPKTPVELTFALPDSDCPLREIKGSVAWRNGLENPVKAGMPPGFGVEFTDLRKEAADMIAAYIKINTP